jgi:dTDP-4-amino-4,6-dideoxygalactose transaminase
MDFRKIPFSPPDISEEEINEVVDTLRSGWITTGPKTKELERKIASWLGVSKTVCLNSQTACAEMILRFLGIGKGDEVITTAYTYSATASVIDHVGAKIVLVDCQKDSFLIDYDEVEKAITNKTKAIIPVDIGGVPCDYNRLFEIVESKKKLFKANNHVQEVIGRIAICADSAHAFGSSFHNLMLGSIADFTTFSLVVLKNRTRKEYTGIRSERSKAA